MYNRNTENVEERLPQTQGRKGHKRLRHNMAFTKVNHEFMLTQARKQGITMTEYVNKLLDDARYEADRAEMMERCHIKSE